MAASLEKTAHYLRNRRLWLLPGHDLPGLFVAAVELDAKLLKLAIEVGALQPDACRDPAHIAAFFHDVMLEVDAFKRVARLAQWQIKRQTERGRRFSAELRERLIHFMGADFLSQSSNCHCMNYVLELAQIARPVIVA